MTMCSRGRFLVAIGLIAASCALLTVGTAAMDPDVKRSIPQMIQSKGYPVETHYVTTSDGYILEFFRIPGPHASKAPKLVDGVHRERGSPRPVTLLWHGLMDNSFTWLFNEPNESLAYILADLGYDVWMGNSRGNMYGTNHTTLDVKSHEFWEFSFDEQAKYDVPDGIKYILKHTGVEKLTYVGHSQGTTQMFAAATIDPSLADIVNLFIGLGPVTSVKHIPNFFFLMLRDLHVDTLFQLLGINRFAPDMEFMKVTFPVLCEVEPDACEDFIEMICGKHQGVFNNSRMAVMGSHEPGGTSVQNMVHWKQNTEADQFQMYDYGSASENQKHYNQDKPPVYDINGSFPSQLPVALWSGGKDTLADPVDVKNLVALLPEKPVFWNEISSYAHVDFLWDVDANVQVYKDLVTVLQQYNPV